MAGEQQVIAIFPRKPDFRRFRHVLNLFDELHTWSRNDGPSLKIISLMTILIFLRKASKALSTFSFSDLLLNCFPFTS